MDVLGFEAHVARPTVKILLGLDVGHEVALLLGLSEGGGAKHNLQR